MPTAPSRSAEQDRAGRKKQAVALGSVLTSAFLASAKLVIGLITGSLAVLAQAADNGLDLVTTLMTYMAVRFAERPPDGDHPYGHGKAESLSALFETALLVLTCGGIAYQAVRRLAMGEAGVRYPGIAVGVMLFSIGVDLVRTAILRRTARRYHSQALAADALNFTGDAEDWLNGGPLDWQQLRGKVVLLDVWTFECWNCYRSFPWLNDLEQR
ncbi:MAG TPA: cation diffusion facilitator family transporter, partial [Anaerolineae bacterium]|nr:cation diffusion facilitator family transporter [Anaerolineae bacterium]